MERKQETFDQLFASLKETGLFQETREPVKAVIASKGWDSYGTFVVQDLFQKYPHDTKCQRVVLRALLNDELVPNKVDRGTLAFVIMSQCLHVAPTSRQDAE